MRVITPENLIEELSKTIQNSEYLKNIRNLKDIEGKSRLFGDGTRQLDKSEIGRMEKNGNRCENWDDILVSTDFIPNYILDNYFYGKCVLGKFTGVDLDTGNSVCMKSGIYRSFVADSEIGDECLLHDNGIISNYIVMKSSVIFRTGTISASSQCRFGNGTVICIGPETGGREVLSYAELTIPSAEAVALNRNNRKLLEDYEKFITEYTNDAESAYGIIEPGAIVRCVNKIYNTYIGSYSIIDGAAELENSTILSSREEPVRVTGGALVSSSCVQWGSAVSSMAIVDNSVLCEHSHAEKHARLSHTILGPNSGIAQGEATSSLVGPFVGFHHQSMLIAAVWPEGKGNVGDGANIGSNHTSRAPDQEFFCGEGVFFGLGVNIKYPSDFRNSPYSVIATGVDTLPQKMEFPFSLINKPGHVHENIPAAYNEIFPGWVFSDNLYAVMRNENKYIERNRATRSMYDMRIFRQDIMEKVVDAGKRLSMAETGKDIYTGKEIPGLGKNYVTIENCIKGIQAYNRIIEYYALTGLAAVLGEAYEEGKQVNISDISSIVTGNSEWEFIKSILSHKESFSSSITVNLKRLNGIFDIITEGVINSKRRDDTRGAKIIKDYRETNTPAADDSFILAFTAKIKDMKDKVAGLIKRTG